MTRERTYGIAAFAALAGVTPRALRHYDRLGLLKPGRAANGYRRYVARDLQALQEIVALAFIGVPLKAIAGIRRRSKGPFAVVLRAQREALEAKRRALDTAIDAVQAAEALIQSGAGVDADAIRRIIEVMQMEPQHEDLMETYATMLRAKVRHLQAMSDADRATRIDHRSSRRCATGPAGSSPSAAFTSAVRTSHSCRIAARSASDIAWRCRTFARSIVA